MSVVGPAVAAVDTPCMAFSSSSNCILTSFLDFQAVSNSWTFLEVNVAIICACLPDIRSLVTRLFPCLGYKQSRSVSQYAADSDYLGENHTSKTIVALHSSHPPTQDDESDEEVGLHDVKVKMSTQDSATYDA